MKSPNKIFSRFTIGLLSLIACNFATAENTNNTVPNTLKAIGGSNIQFTDSQVIPPQADTSYPFKTIGKLWFTKSNGTTGVCTGTMVELGIVATAGHCIHSGNGANSGWSYNFQFSPAYRNGVAPYGIWKQVAFRNTSEGWYYSGGKLPHPADYGIIVFKKNSSGYLIGDYTDAVVYNSWATPLIGRLVTIFGYSNNLDKGTINHRVDSIVAKGVNNTGIFGSNMAVGSEGGPVLTNFGVPATNDKLGWVRDRNTLVSIVSYNAKAPLTNQGGSQLDKGFVTLVNNACKLYPWACPGGSQCQKYSSCP
jgi:V8-like Glu-specific endopeptidase